MRLLSWLAFEGGISKQILSHPLIHTEVTSKTFWVSVLQVLPTLVPRCCRGFQFAVSQHWDKQPVQGSWFLGDALGFVISILSLNVRVAPGAGRRPACSRSPAPGVWIRQKALELVTKVWMWAGKYSPVS